SFPARQSVTPWKTPPEQPTQPLPLIAYSLIDSSYSHVIVWRQIAALNQSLAFCWFEFDSRCDVFAVITGVGYGRGGAKTDIGYLCRSGVNLSSLCLWIEIDCNKLSVFSDDDHIVLFNIEEPDITSNLCSFCFLRSLISRWGFDLGRRRGSGGCRRLHCFI